MNTLEELVGRLPAGDLAAARRVSRSAEPVLVLNEARWDHTEALARERTAIAWGKVLALAVRGRMGTSDKHSAGLLGLSGKTLSITRSIYDVNGLDPVEWHEAAEFLDAQKAEPTNLFERMEGQGVVIAAARESVRRTDGVRKSVAIAAVLRGFSEYRAADESGVSRATLRKILGK